jgi:hypothetical protein
VVQIEINHYILIRDRTGPKVGQLVASGFKNLHIIKLFIGSFGNFLFSIVGVLSKKV